MRLRRRRESVEWQVLDGPGTQSVKVPETGATANHFTTADNWERIQQEGLVPYPQRKDLVEFFPYGVLAWPQEHDLDGEIGSVLFQATRKSVETVVSIGIRYYPSDLMTSSRLRAIDTLTLTHRGTYIDGTPFHTREPFIILQAIPPERVWLRACYYITKDGWS